MTFGEILEFTKRLNSILDSSAPSRIKDIKLANLMTDLELDYQIPMLNDEEFNKSNPYVIQLYRTVSEARTF